MARNQCLLVLICMALFTCLVSGVSLKGTLNDVDDDSRDKESSEEIEKTSNIRGSNEDVQTDESAEEALGNFKKDALDKRLSEADENGDKDSVEDILKEVLDTNTKASNESHHGDLQNISQQEKDLEIVDKNKYSNKDIGTEITTHEDSEENDLDEVSTSSNDQDEIKTSSDDQDEIKTSSDDQDEIKTHIQSTSSKKSTNKHPENLLHNPTNLTSSNSDHQHDALVNQKSDAAHAKKNADDSDEDTDVPAQSGKERKPHRKKRLQPSSSTPSAQLIILVVGAVLACVLITGFIRWRVRKRLNAKKLKQMSENFSLYRGKKDFPKASLMDTIYECDCEHGLVPSSTHDMGILVYSEVSQDDDLSTLEDEHLSKLEEDSSMHRFEVPPSVAGSSYCDVCSHDYFPLKPSRKEPSRGHRKHHGHRNKSSRHHHRRRSHHDKKHTDKIESFNIEINVEDCDTHKSPTFNSPLLGNVDMRFCENSAAEQQSISTTETPSLLTPASAHPPRRVLGALVDTWRSLSFNRDWVGRMWQEKHGVRRISDVLRGLSTISETVRESSVQEHSLSEDTVLKPFATAAQPEEIVATDAFQNEQESDNSLLKVTSTTCDITTESVLPRLEDSCGYFDIRSSHGGVILSGESDQTSSKMDCVVDPPSSQLVEAEPSHLSLAGTFSNCLSDQALEEPPGYCRQLASERWPAGSSFRTGSEHSRHHRKHRRKHRDRQNRHHHSRGGDNEDDLDEELEPLTNIHRSLDVPSPTHHEHQNSDSMAEGQTSHGQGQHSVHNLFSSPNQNTSTMALSYSQQEGIIIERLSDGAQIIYVPPPSLPFYHNDTPPPYHK